jgi:hypothetical protein
MMWSVTWTPLHMTWSVTWTPLHMTWSVTWTPLHMMWTGRFVTCDMMWTLPAEVIVRPVLVMADVHWDSGTSCATFRWTWKSPFGNLQCHALFWLTATAGVYCP